MLRQGETAERGGDLMVSRSPSSSIGGRRDEQPDLEIIEQLHNFTDYLKRSEKII